MLGWDPDALPSDWMDRRRRYFLRNWIRFIATVVAFGVFIAALLVERGGS